MESSKYQLNAVDLKKIGKGALIALIGALIAYISNLLPQIEWGSWTPLVTALGSVAVNAGHKWLAGQR